MLGAQDDAGTQRLDLDLVKRGQQIGEYLIVRDGKVATEPGAQHVQIALGQETD